MEFNSMQSCIIEKKQTRENKKKVILNINSRFRNNYYNQSSTNFQIELPYTIQKVINLSLDSFECSNKMYTFSEKLKTNEFTIETYYFNKRQISGTIREYREDGPQNLKRHVIKIRDGIYTGKQLEKYLNINVFSAPAPGSRVRRYRRINENIDESKLQNDKVEQTRGVFNTDVEAAFADALAAGTDPEVENNPSLDMQQQLLANNAALLAQLEAVNLGTEFDEGEIFFNKVNDTQQVLKRIKCKYDEISRKFIFFRDRNDDVKGLKDTTDKAYKFNISWKLSEDVNRPIQLNMGWILGFRKQHYDENEYIYRKDITTNKFEGYTSESQYKCCASGYVLLSVNDYNKSVGDTILSPFQESSFNDGEILSKLCVDENNTIVYKEYKTREIQRQYYGPVNIKKLKIKLLDEFGREVDLHNTDFSFSLMIEQLYD